MVEKEALRTALGGREQVGADWMPASRVGPFILSDPGVVWLEFYGAQHGFQPDTTAYDFGEFVANKSRQFEEVWMQEVAPEAERVCATGTEVREASRVRRTFELMQQGTPLIAQAALWWAPERVYGAPDLLVHTAWLREQFPQLLKGAEAPGRAQDGYYVVFDHKYTAKLDGRSKATDLEIYSAQVRVYSYILGQLQGIMPGEAYLIARDRVFDPIPVEVGSAVGRPLDEDLATIRDQYSEIKLHGDKYVPWRDEIVVSNLDVGSDRWCTAKKAIALEKTPGGDPSLMYRVGPSAKAALAVQGYTSLETLLQADPDDVPFERIKGLGAKRAAQMRAVLEANRSGTAVLPPPGTVPAQRPFEFYVDYEYFTNVNADFEVQWPELEGCEMVFMIGVGWQVGSDWRFKAFAAKQESHDAEREAFHQALDFLQERTGGLLLDKDAAAIYHWSSAEVWQTRQVADRHELALDHALRRLPWVDLQKVFLNGPAALPGAWGFGLKAVASALGALAPAYEVVWPGDLDAGLQAMVMGWRAYEVAKPLETREMELVREYLETDCLALWQILRWLRSRGK
jgi:uncharacterized protein